MLSITVLIIQTGLSLSWRSVVIVANHGQVCFYVPLPIVKAGLLGLERVAGHAVFATWEEAELMEIPMVSERGTGDAESLGVNPLRMAAVLGA